MKKNLILVVVILIIVVVLFCLQNYFKVNKPIDIHSLVSQKDIDGISLRAGSYEPKDITQGWEDNKIVEIKGEYSGSNQKEFGVCSNTPFQIRDLSWTYGYITWLKNPADIVDSKHWLGLVSKEKLNILLPQCNSIVKGKVKLRKIDGIYYGDLIDISTTLSTNDLKTELNDIEIFKEKILTFSQNNLGIVFDKQKILSSNLEYYYDSSSNTLVGRYELMKQNVKCNEKYNKVIVNVIKPIKQKSINGIYLSLVKSVGDCGIY